MRWRILKALLKKELLRHLTNRGALTMLVLLLASAMLSSFVGVRSSGEPGLNSSIQICYVDYDEEGPLVRHLQRNVPESLAQRLKFRPLSAVPTDSQGKLQYPSFAAAIQLRPPLNPTSSGTVWFWYSGDRSAIAEYETWFWKETLRYVQKQPVRRMNDSLPSIVNAPLEEDGFVLGGGFDSRTGLATALVFFGTFLLCTYLLPSFSCEERERGVLLAQALSPATTWELLGARVLFYAALGIAFSTVLASIQKPQVLLLPFFWLAITVIVLGAMGVGLTIAALARTQRSASMAATSYLMAVSLLLYVCQQNQIAVLPWLALEYHGPRMLHAALSGSIFWFHWGNLLGATILAMVWLLLAGLFFRRRGWQ